MILNQEYSFSDVRYLINTRHSNDVELCFTHYPRKVRLEAGASLVRLDFPVLFGIFMKLWWMRQDALQSILHSADSNFVSLRQAWQHQQAMPKASKGIRTLIVEIQLTAPVYAWIGTASPLFNKSGGAEQVYLPNLARGVGPNGSDFARLKNTYTLAAVL